MFYPVASLKKGGRFYLCWVADSWPLRFATITHRQLWSQDVRKICDYILEFMTNESGRPDHRFSLRLSSQLMRGLVRIYQKKVNVFLSDLCMLNANVTKHVNRKFIIPKAHVVRPVSQPRLQVTEQIPQITVSEEPETEQRLEEIYQKSGHVVTDIQDITLKEATIPELQLLPTDGFGEEQAVGVDRTMEMMMFPAEATAHASALDITGLELTDRSHEHARTLRERRMESFTEHDVTLFRKSAAEETVPEFGKDISEIPDIPIPEPHILPQDQVAIDKEHVERWEEPIEAAAVAQLEEIELEELEEAEPQPKRRRVRKLIIDKKTKIDANTLRARIQNTHVELRCEDSSYDTIEIRVPVEVYLRRPCHAGASVRSNLGSEITRLFMRNLGVVHRSTSVEKAFQEEIMYRPQRPRIVSEPERVEEVEQPPAPEEERPTEPMEAVEPHPDIQARKRTSLSETSPSPKRQRDMGYVTIRKRQQDTHLETSIPAEAEAQLTLQQERELDKENVPENMQETFIMRETGKSLTELLQEAGIADIVQGQEEATFVAPAAVTSQVRGSRAAPGASRDSETPLGSLDRTKVSLGESEETTDSRRFIRNEWGTEGTMRKILIAMKQGLKPITVKTLTSKGPVLSGYNRLIAARCFSSILKLKQHQFITVQKCPGTLEIEDIGLGPKIY